MKNFSRFLLILLLVTTGWQFGRSYFTHQEREIRSDIRESIEQQFSEMASGSNLRFDLKQLHRTAVPAPNIVLIHGLDDPGKVWMNLAPALGRENYNVWEMNYPNDQAVLLSASLFHQITPGRQGLALVNAAFPGHNFDVLHGLTCQIDLSTPPRFYPDGTQRPGGNRRIRNACHDGQPMAEGQRFVVALNSYRASGGGGFAALKDARHLPIESQKISGILRAYLAGHLPCDPLATASPPWAFAPMPGTTVSVLTGPGAVSYLSDLKDRNVRVCGTDADGFLRLEVGL